MSRLVAVIVPTLNEERRIGPLLAQIARQPACRVVDILVADGGSTDDTRAIVEAAAREDPRVRLIHNPARIQSAGVNRAVLAADARADTIVRIDAHALYPDDYIPRLLAAFDATGAEMVAVRLDTQGETCFQRGVAIASNSRAGTGGSAHRVGGYSGFVDHAHHAGMDRATFMAVGGYDATFDANEDAEFDYRVRRAGGRIWLAGDIEVVYFPRPNLRRLFTQYARYGRGRARTFLKHRERLRPRQMIPPAIVVTLALSLIGAAVRPALLLVPLGYLLLICVLVAPLVVRSRSRCALIAVPATVTMHLAWGLGFSLTMARSAVAKVVAPSPRRKAAIMEERH